MWIPPFSPTRGVFQLLNPPGCGGSAWTPPADACAPSSTPPCPSQTPPVMQKRHPEGVGVPVEFLTHHGAQEFSGQLSNVLLDLNHENFSCRSCLQWHPKRHQTRLVLPRINNTWKSGKYLNHHQIFSSFNSPIMANLRCPAKHSDAQGKNVKIPLKMANTWKDLNYILYPRINKQKLNS